MAAVGLLLCDPSCVFGCVSLLCTVSQMVVSNGLLSRELDVAVRRRRDQEREVFVCWLVCGVDVPAPHQWRVTSLGVAVAWSRCMCHSYRAHTSWRLLLSLRSMVRCTALHPMHEWGVCTCFAPVLHQAKSNAAIVSELAATRQIADTTRHELAVMSEKVTPAVQGARLFLWYLSYPTACSRACPWNCKPACGYYLLMLPRTGPCC